MMRYINVRFTLHYIKM